MPLWIIISFIIVSVVCIYSVAKLFKSDKMTYAKSALCTYIFYAVIFLAVWIFRISVPPYTLLLTMLTVLVACFFGHYLDIYTKSKTFDRYLHAFGAFSYALLTYCILDDLVTTGGSELFRAIFIFMIGVTLGGFFELIEMKHDKKSNKDEPPAQKGLIDTDMDILFNIIGSIIAAIFAYIWIL